MSLLTAVVLATVPAASVHAQRAGDSLAGGRGGSARQKLEQRFRERSADIVRRQLQLNDNQMSRLQGVNRQFEAQRVSLFEEERQARQALRAELTSTNPNQQKVATLLDQLMGVSRRRFDIQANEQRELAKFLTPVQRAKYFGLQNQLRQRLEEVQKRGAQRGRRFPLRPPAGKRDFR
jgi:Spy/CpxP family protein refolding chaperone